VNRNKSQTIISGQNLGLGSDVSVSHTYEAGSTYRYGVRPSERRSVCLSHWLAAAACGFSSVLLWARRVEYRRRRCTGQQHGAQPAADAGSAAFTADVGS